MKALFLSDPWSLRAAFPRTTYKNGYFASRMGRPVNHAHCTYTECAVRRVDGPVPSLAKKQWR